MRTVVASLVALSIVVSGSRALAGITVPSVYLALGDSLAYGVGASSVANTAYVPRFFRYLRGADHGDVDTLVNLGIGGDTSYWFIAGTPWGQGPQLTQALAAISDPATDVRVVTLDIGANDLLNTLFRDPACVDRASIACRAAVVATLSQFAANYQTILSALRAALAADPGTERIYVLTYFNVWGGTGDPLEPLADLLLLGGDLRVDCAANATDPTKIGLNDLIACIGMANQVEIVDLYGAIGDRALELTHIAEGDIHPNDAGYAWIARELMEAERAD